MTAGPGVPTPGEAARRGVSDSPYYTERKMYGLVNKAVQKLVVTEFGEDKWEAVKRKAGIDAECFVSMRPYPDDMTYKLVAAATEVLGLTAEQILEAFGDYWTLYSAKEGYGELLKTAGGTLVEFLGNLDQLHARVGLSFPEFKPPSFRCSDVNGGSLRLHYYSDRPGLTHFVVGLVKGLGHMFSTDVRVTIEQTREAGHDHDVFRIEYRER